MADETLDFGKVPWHPAAEAYELLPEKKGKGRAPGMSLEELAESIRTHGLKRPILYWIDPDTQKTWKIDGRNREAACALAGIKPKYQQERIPAGSSVVEHIKILNGERRHLTPSQRAMAAARLLPLIEAENKARAAAERKARKTTGEKVPESEKTGRKSATHAARVTGASGRNVTDAKQILGADPELAKKVASGEIKIHAARRILKRRAEKERLEDASLKLGTPEEGKTFSVINGDCLEELPTGKLPAGTANLIVLDPPYNIGVDYGDGTRADRLSDTDYLEWMEKVLSYCTTLLHKNGTLVLIVSDEYAAQLSIILTDCGLHRRAWIKWYETFGVNNSNGFNRTSRHVLYMVKSPKVFTFNESVFTRQSARQRLGDRRAHPDGKTWDDVWGIEPPIPRLVENARERLPEFPTQLPLALIQPIVDGFSNPADLVVDPMMGSGTVGEACIRSGRCFVGIEKQKNFADLARGRLLRAAHDVARVARKTQAPSGSSESPAEDDLADSPDSPANGKAHRKARKPREVLAAVGVSNEASDEASE